MRHLAFVLSIAATGACAQAPAGPGAPAARAALIDLEGNAAGFAEFFATPSGVLIRAQLEGLPPGVKGFHIHEVGECVPPFESAGGHYNPTDVEHGFFSESGPHAGDMPNIEAPDSGAVTVEVLNPFIRLEEGDVFDEDGASLMVHSGPDDYASQPAGDAGDRIACGIIEASDGAAE